MTGGKCRQSSLLTWNLFIGQFVHIVEGDGMKRVERRDSLSLPAANFTLLQNMLIWCKMKVIIYPITYTDIKIDRHKIILFCNFLFILLNIFFDDKLVKFHGFFFFLFKIFLRLGIKTIFRQRWCNQRVGWTCLKVIFITWSGPSLTQNW